MYVSLFFVSAFGGSLIQEDDIIENRERDIKNWSDTKLNWNSTYYDVQNDNESEHFERIVYYFTDWSGKTMFEIGRYGMVYGYENPNSAGYKNVLTVVYLAMGLWVLSFCIPIILPVVVVIYLLYQYIKKKKVKSND